MSILSHSQDSDMSERRNPDSAAGEADGPEDRCCENPVVSRVPENRFKTDTNRTGRECYYLCTNCGTENP